MRSLPLALAILIFAPQPAGTREARTAPFDLLIRGGRVVDGTGAPWFRADVGVRDGRIAAIGQLKGQPARREINAHRLVVAPGFIDLLGQSEYSVLVDSRAASKITQGITTEVTGEGDSIAPLDDAMLAEDREIHARYGFTPDFRTLDGFFRTLERRGSAINLGTFVGAASVRKLTVGRDDRPATAEQLRRMEELVEQAMADGALGVSTSLQYVPGMYARTDELIALAKAAARYGGSYFTHVRSESARLDGSLDEAIRIAREAGIRTQVWHLKTAYRPQFGRMPEILRKLERARAAGVDISANQYPWNRASNGLDACLPPWVREGGRMELLKRLGDPLLRARAREDMARSDLTWENQWLGSGGAEGVMVAEVLDSKLKAYQGRVVAEIARTEGKDPRDVVIDLVIADKAHAFCIISIMDEADVRAALVHPLVAFCTDSQAKGVDGPFAGEISHPRGWGSATRILGHYVRDQRLLTLEEAVRKMTSFPAQAAGLKDRGLVKEGFAADLVLFDPTTVASRATFEQPNQYSAGAPFVAVNGVLVVDGGRLTGATPGKALRGPGWRKP
jgi:dihydroorotase/N-acyl-D-amino-acid deacylase